MEIMNAATGNIIKRFRFSMDGCWGWEKCPEMNVRCAVQNVLN